MDDEIDHAYFRFRRNCEWRVSFYINYHKLEYVLVDKSTQLFASRKLVTIITR